MFKVGDIVECVDNRNYSYLIIGNSYTVWSRDSSTCEIRNEIGKFFYYPMSCFKLKTSNSKTPTIIKSTQTTYEFTLGKWDIKIVKFDDIHYNIQVGRDSIDVKVDEMDQFIETLKRIHNE